MQLINPNARTIIVMIGIRKKNADETKSDDRIKASMTNVLLAETLIDVIRIRADIEMIIQKPVFWLLGERKNNNPQSRLPK